MILPRKNAVVLYFAPAIMLCCLTTLPAATKTISIIPKPVEMIVGNGNFCLTPMTVIVVDKTSILEGEQLSQMLSPATGLALEVRNSAAAETPVIEIMLDSSLERLGEEGYQLKVTPRKVSIRAPRSAGLFYAFQSLRQLLPPEIFRTAPVAGVEWAIPCVQIEDFPRFKWRGALLDSARHFMPKGFVKKFIDLLALHKMNTFNWHLTDDQGWRIEIKKYPKLTAIGAWRKETLVGRMADENSKDLKFDGSPHGGFYTQGDIREIVEYARVRHVNIVPEIEMPGHAQAAIASYPELGNTSQPVEVDREWGISENIFNVNESTFRFLQDVMTEVLELFPSHFIVCGGDEVPKTQWKANPKVQARMRELGLKNEEELQVYFAHRMDEFLTSQGRRMIWDEDAMEGGLPSNALVMAWRGEERGIETIRAGHDVVMMPDGYTYFDYYQSKDTAREPLAIGGFLPLEVVYSYEPVPKGISEELARHVLGTQGSLWTEYIPHPKHLEYMAFPRLTALAEVMWVPSEKKDFPEFLERLATHLKRLCMLDVNYRPLDVRN